MIRKTHWSNILRNVRGNRHPSHEPKPSIWGQARVRLPPSRWFRIECPKYSRKSRQRRPIRTRTMLLSHQGKGIPGRSIWFWLWERPRPTRAKEGSQTLGSVTAPCCKGSQKCQWPRIKSFPIAASTFLPRLQSWNLKGRKGQWLGRWTEKRECLATGRGKW